MVVGIWLVINITRRVQSVCGMAWRSTGSHCKLHFFHSISEEESNKGLFRPSHVLNSLGKPRMQMDQKSGSGKEIRENRGSLT